MITSGGKMRIADLPWVYLSTTQTPDKFNFYDSVEASTLWPSK